MHACNRPVHEDVAAERLAAEGALVQEAVGLLRLRVGDAEHGRRAPRRGRSGAPAVLRLGAAAVGGAPRPVGLRAAATTAAAAREHRREVGVAEGVEVGRRELHRPAGVVRPWHVWHARAGRSRSCRHTANGGAGRQLGWAWREERRRGSVLNQPQDGNGMAVN